MSPSDHKVGEVRPAQQMAVVLSSCLRSLHSQCPSFRCGTQLQGSKLQALPEGAPPRAERLPTVSPSSDLSPRSLFTWNLQLLIPISEHREPQYWAFILGLSIITSQDAGVSPCKIFTRGQIFAQLTSLTALCSFPWPFSPGTVIAK